MEGNSSRVIVSTGFIGGSTQVHHQAFPEIRAQGESATVAALHLTHQLTRALDSALIPWRREPIQKAITDVQSFTRAGGI
jgi:hypothetical protein